MFEKSNYCRRNEVITLHANPCFGLSRFHWARTVVCVVFHTLVAQPPVFRHFHTQVPLSSRYTTGFNVAHHVTTAICSVLVHVSQWRGLPCLTFGREQTNLPDPFDRYASDNTGNLGRSTIFHSNAFLQGDWRRKRSLQQPVFRAWAVRSKCCMEPL